MNELSIILAYLANKKKEKKRRKSCDKWTEQKYGNI